MGQRAIENVGGFRAYRLSCFQGFKGCCCGGCGLADIYGVSSLFLSDRIEDRFAKEVA